MKKSVLAFTAVLAAFLYMPCCISCTEASKEQETEKEKEKEEIPTPENTNPQPGTYTFTVSAMKGQWEVGDQIYVHGSYGPKAQMITLQASDISSDGKTATAQLGAVTEYIAQPDCLYAAWPGEAVIQEDGMTDAATGFSKIDGLMCVAYLQDHNFAFVDASACLTFKAPGYTDFALAGKQRPGLRFTGYEALYTSAETDFFGRKTDGYPFLYGKLSDGSVTLWIPGTLTIKKGYTLYLGKDGAWPVCYTVDKETRFSAGTVTDLGDITASLEPYTGPIPKMPEMTGYKKFEVKLTELSGLCLSADGTFLWGVGDGSELAQLSFEGEVLKKASLVNTYLDGNGKEKTRSLDSEGLSLNYDTGDLLIAGEANYVFCITADELPNVFKESSYKGVKHLFNIKEAKGYSNAGMEGIAYYKNGLVYCGTQTGSDLFLCDLNAPTDDSVYHYTEIVWKKRLVELHPSVTEIGGLCYDPLTDWLWITDSEAKRITALTGDGETILGSYSVRQVVNAESIFVDHARSCIWVGCDNDSSTSHLFRFDFTGLDDAIITE